LKGRIIETRSLRKVSVFHVSDLAICIYVLKRLKFGGRQWLYKGSWRRRGSHIGWSGARRSLEGEVVLHIGGFGGGRRGGGRIRCAQRRYFGGTTSLPTIAVCQ
jgi:hypothetical protein